MQSDFKLGLAERDYCYYLCGVDKVQQARACEICQFSESKRIKYEQDMYDEKRLRGEMKGERRKGVEEGRMEEKLENARSLKERGVSLEVISEALGLPIETVREL